MKNQIYSAATALAIFALALILSPNEASAQFFHGVPQQQPSFNGCPSATVYFQNGYSSNYCVPSYYPSPVTYQTPQLPYYGNQHQNYYPNPYGNPTNPLYTQPYHPFQPPQTAPFYPYTPAPTYYYPPAPRYPNWPHY